MDDNTFLDELQQDFAAQHEEELELLRDMQLAYRQNEFNGHNGSKLDSRHFFAFIYMINKKEKMSAVCDNFTHAWPDPFYQLSPLIPAQRKYPKSPDAIPDLTTGQIEDVLLILGEIIARLEVVAA